MFGAKLTDYVVTFLLVFLACQRRNFSKIELQRLFPYDSSVVIVKISSNEKMWWKIKKKEKKIFLKTKNFQWRYVQNNLLIKISWTNFMVKLGSWTF